ncbi:hypothetical protein EW145_g2938 [Phellinidium pouzarii]|uniref:Uncharacterized protein n=1 Tax=Phellinidium pouzarii TaxID=167371 RepID=A0A4S4L973_9AGAM|nr:hypothetical protein EW145_g2938 [Phellinidium pouzarii]
MTIVHSGTWLNTSCRGRGSSSTTTTMENVHPQDLPVFLDPLLDYFSEHLPASLYDTIFTVFSYGIMLLSGLFSLVAGLLSWKPWEWDAQKILPPLIIFLTAYYTLLSLYRTTSFMVRMTFRVVKWGLIFGLLGTSIGWFAGTNGGQTGSALSGASQGQEGSTTAGGRTGGRARPRPWESFTAHYQYNEQDAQHAEDTTTDAQHVIQYIKNLAGRAVGGSAFDLVAGAKGFLDNIAEAASSNSGEDETTAGQGKARKQTRRKAKTSTQRRTTFR